MDPINRWDALPEECKSIILSRLSTREVARIARVSKEFLRAVNVMRSSVQLLVLPPSMSVSAMEGMVAAHPNLKSLSFKRCGMKLKTFVPIIKAAAAGFTKTVDNDTLESAVSEKKRVRSLIAVDFRNCTHLIDTDISILCSLHTRLEQVDLTNCPFVSDTALLTLSRYQHVEKTTDPLGKYSCYPRYLEKSSKGTSDTFAELDEVFLRNNDAAVFEEIQGLGLNSYNFRSWPKIGGSMERARKETLSHLQASSRKYEEGKLMAASQTSNANVLRKGDPGVSASPISGGKKSYAQMAAKPMEKVASSSCTVPCEKSSPPPSCLQPVKPAELDSSDVENIDLGPFDVPHKEPAYLDPSLPFVDWSLYDFEHRNEGSNPLSLAGVGLLSDYCSPSSSSLVPEENSSREIAVTNRYRDMYKHYLIDDVQSSTCALPDLIDNLCLSKVHNQPFTQAHCNPILPPVDDRGSKYTTAITAISGNQMTRTQTSVVIRKNSSGNVDGEQSQRRGLCVGSGTEVRDQRVQLDPLSRPGETLECSSEAFCRTVNHVGVFAVPGVDPKGQLGHDNRDKVNNRLKFPRPSALVENEVNSRLAICLPDATDISRILKKNSPPSDCHLEPLIGSDRSVASEAHADVEIDISKYLPGLRTVCVASCPEITDRGIQALLKGTSRTCLSTLDVSRCGGVTNAGLRLPARSGLQNLIAVQMPAINRLVYQLPIQSALQHLNLAGCYKLDELVLVASSLKTLNLSNCKKLARLHLKCPSLTALNLSLCDGLERFVKFQCSMLQSLNIMGCRMLLQSALNGAIDSAGILEDLRCGGCDRIERLDLVQPTLLTLDVSGSQSLKRLFCQSKVLRVVDACGCKALAEVYLYSSYLRRMLFSNCALLQILVIPLDAIKESIDASATQGRRAGSGKQQELEISISGCNMPEIVKKNLAKLTKQWQSCFKVAT